VEGSKTAAVRWQIGDHRFAVPVTSHNEARCHILAKQSDTAGRPPKNRLAQNSPSHGEIGATEIFLVDLRSYSEIWKRWGRMDNGKVGIVGQIGGRYVDGWRNPPRHAMPEADEDLPASDDPWRESSSLVLKRLSDDQLLTWSTRYTALWKAWGNSSPSPRRTGMPVVLLESAPDGKNFKPRLRIIGWQAFGEGESPPADPARGAVPAGAASRSCVGSTPHRRP
jgi:hypothetical protein